MLSKKTLQGLSIGLIVALLLSMLFTIGFFGSWQRFFSDVLYQEKEPFESIVILSIDDQSLQEIGRWPWQREFFVELFEKLDDASVVGVDVAFFEDYDAVIDKRLGETIEKSNAKFILPVEYIEFEHGKGIELIKTIEPIRQSAYSLGFINVFTDIDGITRRIPLSIEGKENYNSFALEIYKAYLDRDLDYSGKNLMINFIGKPGTFETISTSDFLNKTFDITDKIVLIGATSPDLHDDYFVPTSYGKAMPGVEVHANAIQTMLTKSFLSEQSRLSAIILIFLICIISGIVFSSIRNLYLSIPLSILMIIAYFLTAIFSFSKGLVLNVIYPSLSIIFVLGASIIVSYSAEAKARKKILDTFGRYVSREVADEILKSKKIDLYGQEREITVLFADIRGFTALSEKLTPHQVVDMLNNYLGGMTEAVLEEKGTLDKYIGDCLMAVYNAPLSQPDHVIKAIRSAISMQKAVSEISKTKKVPKVQCGIGINTGEAVIGNIGSEKRLDYTAIGDTVNLASRLCSAAKGNQIIISDDTYQKVKKEINVRKIGKIKVKGKVKPILVYEVKSLR